MSLLPKPMTVNSTVILKLKSGAEVVGRLAQAFEAGATYVSLTKVLQLQPMQDPKTGELSLGYVPFSLSADDNQVFRFSTDNLMVDPYPARKEVADSFQQSTSSIVMP